MRPDLESPPAQEKRCPAHGRTCLTGWMRNEIDLVPLRPRAGPGHAGFGSQAGWTALASRPGDRKLLIFDQHGNGTTPELDYRRNFVARDEFADDLPAGPAAYAGPPQMPPWVLVTRQ
jgi:hypothetical protein